MINHRGHREHGVKEFAKISPNKAAWEAAFERARSHVFAENIAKQAKAKPAVRKLRSNSLPDADWAGPGWKVFKPSSSEMRSSLPRQSGAAWLMSANLKPALRELAARSGRIVEFGAVDSTMDYLRYVKGVSKDKKRQIYESMRDTAWGQTAVDPKQASKWQKGIYKARENQALSSHNRSNEKAGEMLSPGKRRGHLAELAARSGRIVEFGDGEADEAVIAALKAAASADETPAQRAMLLKRGLIEMVKGQLVITERGYDMMKKAGVPPKLTPEERREEIMGTEEEKRLSRFDHRGHRVEFARGDYAIPALKNALKRGIGNGGDAISIHEIGVSGSAVPSLRGNAGNVRRALNKFWESPHSMKEATGLMKGTRKWAAQTIRDARKEGFGRSDRLSSHLGRLDRIYGIKDSGVA